MKVQVALRGIAFSGASGRPVPQSGEGGNPWRTGRCLLYCRRENVRVLVIGVVQTPLMDGELSACEQCVAELLRLVREERLVKEPPRRRRRMCEHRELEKWEGKTFCQGCKRQIYL